MKNVQAVRDFVIEHFLYGDDEGLTNETSFLEKGIIDSTGILELVSFLESHFSVEVDDDEVTPENMDTLNNIAKFLERKLEAKETTD